MRRYLLLVFLFAAFGIAAGQTCTVTNSSLPNAPQNVVYPSWDDLFAPWTVLTTNGACVTTGHPVLTWTVTGLPTGLSYAYDTTNNKGYIVGTATASFGTYPVSLQVSGSNGTSPVVNLSITVVQQVPSFSPGLNYYTSNFVGNSSPTYKQFLTPQTVTITGPVGATICYVMGNAEPTTDGNGNCTGSTLNFATTGPVLVQHSTLFRAVATKAGQTDSNIIPGYYDIIENYAPVLPRTYIPTTLNSTNFPCLFAPATPVHKYVKASGGDYTSLAAAWAAVNTDTASGTLCEIIDVDPESTGFTAATLGQGVTIKYRAHMNAGIWVWTRSAGFGSLPAQGSDGETCVDPNNGDNYGCAVNHNDRPNMFKVVKQSYAMTGSPSHPNANNYDYGLAFCGDVTGGSYTCSGSGVSNNLIITGMDFQFCGLTSLTGSCTTTPPYQFVYDLMIIGDYTNTVPPSNIIVDRSEFDTVSGGFDEYAKTAIAIEGGASIAVVDSFFDHLWEPANLYGTAWQGQNVLWIAGQGPGKLVNNWFGGNNVETVMFGGSTGGIVNQGDGGTPNMGWPMDIEVRRNMFIKNNAVTGPVYPASCITDGTKAGEANDFEFKGGEQFALIEGNILLYSPSAGAGACYQQNGNLMAVKDDQNGPPWCVLCQVSDVTIRYNYGSHANIAIELLGHDQIGKEYPVVQRVWAHDNLFTDINHITYGGTYSGAFTIGSTGGGANAQSYLVEAPGPWFATLNNMAFYGTPNNQDGTTQLLNPQGGSFGTCSSPGDVYPNLVFNSNVTVLDGDTGTTAGQEILNGACEQSPFIYIGNGVFPNASWGNGAIGGSNTGNAMFNFKNTGTGSPPETCDLSTGYAGWGGTNPGICPGGLATSPTTINTVLGIADYASCAAAAPGTGSPNNPTACIISGPNAGVGPSISGILAARALGNDYYANGSPPAPGAPSTMGGKLTIGGTTAVH